MTNEPDRKDVDTLVSEIYRELADERTPQHLNQAVLQMAAGKETRRGLNFSLWMKPVAWAATIALSLAIVLEFTELPTQVRRTDVAVPAAESLPQESVPQNFSPQDADIVERAERRAKLQAVIAIPESEPKPKVDSFAVSAPGTNQPSVKKHAVSQDRASFVDAAIPSREDTAQLEEIVVTPSAAPIVVPTVAPSADFAVTTENLRERTLGVSRLAEEKAESDAMNECAPEARLTAEIWLACIKDLHALGAFDAAAWEYEAYSDEYPGELADFEANK